MVKNRSRSRRTAFFGCLLITVTSVLGFNNAQALVIGGFAAARGGANKLSSIVREPWLANLFPTATLRETNSLTEPGFFDNLDLLVLDTVFRGSAPHPQGFDPLTGAEQTAFDTYVRSGGSAIVFTDNVFATHAADQSVLHPYGIVTGGIFGGTVTGLPRTGEVHHPLVDGPFGVVNSFRGAATGSFFDPGIGNPIAEWALDPSEPNNSDFAVVALDSNQLGAGAGRAVFFSDHNIREGRFTGNPSLGNEALLENSLAWALSGSNDFSFCSVPAGLGVGCSLLGGAGVPGGLDVSFDNVTAAGAVSVELNPPLSFPPIDFFLPIEPRQLWDIDFAGTFQDFVTLTFGLDGAGSLAGLSGLSVLHFLADGSFEVLRGVIDPINNTLTVRTTSLSPFLLGIANAVPEPDTLILFLFGGILAFLGSKRLFWYRGLYRMHSGLIAGTRGERSWSINFVGDAGGLRGAVHQPWSPG